MCQIMKDMRNESLQQGIKQGIKQGIQEGMKQGIKQGMTQGIKEGMKAVALRMLNAGKYALEEIANVSGLPLDEVKKLKAE